MNFLDTIVQLKAEGKEFVVVTLVEVTGSAPQEVGAKIIVTNDGLFSGTIGGGKVEMQIIKEAKELLIEKKKFKFQKYNLQTDIGMTCGGVVRFSFETYLNENNQTIAIFGAGHVAQELIKVLSRLKFNLICIDPRQDWLDRIDSLIKIKKICTDQMHNEVDYLPSHSFILSLTMGHAFDRPILAKALQKNFPFIGVIGSDKKAIVLKKELKELDLISEEQLTRLHCPIGENFGNNEPEEIAISIVAQILKIRDKHS